MDYYQKYLKYKNKYLILRKKLYGDDLSEEQKINNFSNKEDFIKKKGGMESSIYLDTKNNLIYKVIKKRDKINRGPWGKVKKLMKRNKHLMNQFVDIKLHRI